MSTLAPGVESGPHADLEHDVKNALNDHRSACTSIMDFRASGNRLCHLAISGQIVSRN
jgi:hypothetical protein